MTSTRGRIIIFAAASGGGKTTILDWLRSRFPGLVYSISATTRQPRGSEVDGVHYFFYTKEEFERRIAANEFAEWALVHGNYYGTPRSFVDATIAAGRHVVMDIDVQGTATFRRCYPESVGIFLMPPAIAELERRLRARGTDDDATIATRLANATGEIAAARSSGDFEFFIMNDDLDRCKAEVLALITQLTAPA